MVYQRTARLDAVFAALSDPTRRQLVAALRGGSRSISALAAPFRMTLPGVSKHLRVLEQAGLVSRRRRGRQWDCTLETQPMVAAAAWLDGYREMWQENLDRLAVYLGEDHPQEAPCLPVSTLATSSKSPAGSRARPKPSSRRGRR